MELKDRYVQILKHLFPKGIAWTRATESTFHKLIQSKAEEMARFDTRVGTDLINEAYPDTTLELLEDWERIVGLPDSCQPTLAETITGRREDVLRKLVFRGGQSRKFFIDLAAAFGYTITIDEIRPFRAGRGRCGDRCYDIDWLHHWRVISNSSISTYFRAGIGRCGDRLRISVNTELECVISKVKPAHTVVHFVYL